MYVCCMCGCVRACVRVYWLERHRHLVVLEKHGVLAGEVQPLRLARKAARGALRLKLLEQRFNGLNIYMHTCEHT